MRRTKKALFGVPNKICNCIFLIDAEIEDLISNFFHTRFMLKWKSFILENLIKLSSTAIIPTRSDVYSRQKKINFTVLEKHHVEGVEASIKPQAYNLTRSRLNGKSIARNQVIYRDRCQHSTIIFIQTLRCIKLQWFHFFLMTSKSHYNTLWTALKHARVGKFKLYPLSVNERHF